MNEVIFVIAGDYQQFMSYKLRKNTGQKFVYVSTIDTLRGQKDPHGVFIGTWRQRQDIHVILEELMVRSTNPIGCDRLRDIKSSIPISVDQAVAAASQRLAKEIDQHVLDSMIKPADVEVPYSTLVPHMIKAIQELSNKVTQLENK